MNHNRLGDLYLFALLTYQYSNRHIVNHRVNDEVKRFILINKK